MDFAEARAAFFQPRDDAAPGPDLDAGPAARRLRHVLEPIAMVHIWAEPAQKRLAEAGLDFLAGYVGGRACVLGDVAPAVVAATFGVFEPGLAGDLWSAARAQCSVADLLRVREVGATESMREVLDGFDGGVAPGGGVDGAVATLRGAIEAVRVVEVSGRPLFAGLAALPWPSDPGTALWHAASVLREHRGDAHLGACTAAGIDGLEANVLTELRAGYGLLEYTASRGWPQEAMDAAVARLEQRGLVAGGALTPEGVRLRDAIEDDTDRAQDRVLAAVGGGLDGLVGVLGRIADLVVERGWFPPDPYKRAAG